jgi:hypothetical protein
MARAQYGGKVLYSDLNDLDSGYIFDDDGTGDPILDSHEVDDLEELNRNEALDYKDEDSD